MRNRTVPQNLLIPAAALLGVWLVQAGWAAAPQTKTSANSHPIAVLSPAATALEAKTKTVAPKCVQSTVGIIVRVSDSGKKDSGTDGSGSGVVVSADGLILTVGHVLQVPGTPLTIRFADGRVVKGVSLGMDHEVDTGMARIADPAPAGGWPFSPVAPPESARPGEWVLATGHPGSIVVDRNPPLRLGRVVEHSESDVVSNCPIEPGDSGGPLFDLSGRVVGINTAINGTGSVKGRPTGWSSHHVPISLYAAQWKDLLAGQEAHPDMRHGATPALGEDFDTLQVEEAVLKLAEQKDSEALKILEKVEKSGGRLHMTPEQAARILKKAGMTPNTKQTGIPADLRPFFGPGLKQSLLKEVPGATITDALLERIMDKAQFDLATAQMHMAPDPEDLAALGIPAEAIDKLMGESDQSTRLSRQYDRTSLQTLALVAPALDAAGNCVVEIFSEDKPILLGTIVAADGWIVTKASDLGDKLLTVVLPDGNSLEAKVIGKDQATDLALLKIEAQGLTPAQFSSDSPLGGWLASPVRDPNRPAVGVVSVAARPIPKEFAHFFGNTRVILGLATAPDSCKVEIVSPGMPAEKAGVKVGDVVLAINGKTYTDPRALVARVKQAKPGETLTLKIRRGGKVLELRPVLGEAKNVEETEHGIGEEDGIAAGKLSQRRTDFPLAIQHDAAVWAEECGGPLINLQGKTVGVNIARYDQVCAFAIPAELVEKTIAQLREKADDNIDAKHSQRPK